MAAKIETESLLKHLVDLIKKHGEGLSLRRFEALSKGKYSERPYVTRWGSWLAAKEAAIKYANNNDIEIAKNKGKKEEVLDLDNPVEHENALLRKEIDHLRQQITYLKKERVSEEEIKKYLFDLKDLEPEIPNWTVDLTEDTVIGVPCLQLSDWHFNEIVFPEQVFGKNEYNITIAKTRVRNLARATIDLLKSHLGGDYPGIVVLLNGDFLSGDIHEDLTSTNDKPMMPAFLDVFNVLSWFLETMLSEFNKVMVFGCVGNHPRTTDKIPAKNKTYTNYDWLLYRLVEKWFEEKDGINFYISDGDDLQFKIYHHRYRMTHGDQFRGGTGFIGPYAPITRGEIRKRAAAETLNINYDTLVIGHFHQLMVLDRVIVNGSLVGYDELGVKSNFPYQDPKQALWITHPRRGITISAPVFCDRKMVQKYRADGKWVSWMPTDGTNKEKS